MNRPKRSMLVIAVLAAFAGGGVIAAIRWSASPQTGGIADVLTDGCTVRELPGSGQVAAVAIDPTGRYIAGSANGSAALWVDGKPRILDTTAPQSHAVAVNASGVVVGYSSGIGAWVYRDGRLSPLPKLTGHPAGTGATAINSHGDIVGNDGAQGVIWPADQPGKIIPIGDGASTMNDISDHGLIVGTLFRDNAGHLWNRDGTIHPLPASFPYEPALVAGAWVLGSTVARAGTVGFRYALWNVTTGAIFPLTVNPAAGFLANHLGASGTAIGYYVAADHTTRSALFRDHKIILLSPPQGVEDNTEAKAISADGRTIVGTNNGQALLWHC